MLYLLTGRQQKKIKLIVAIYHYLYASERILMLIGSLDFHNYPHGVNRKNSITNMFSRGIRSQESEWLAQHVDNKINRGATT